MARLQCRLRDLKTQILLFKDWYHTYSLNSLLQGHWLYSPVHENYPAAWNEIIQSTYSMWCEEN